MKNSLEVAKMNNETQNDTIICNEALRGKPYLDIDRVITEGNPKSSNQYGSNPEATDKSI
jgi:hypothetical protein